MTLLQSRSLDATLWKCHLLASKAPARPVRASMVCPTAASMTTCHTQDSCLCSSAVASTYESDTCSFLCLEYISPPDNACGLLPRRKQMPLYQFDLPRPTCIKYNTSLDTYLLVTLSQLDFSWQHFLHLRYYQLGWNLKRTDDLIVHWYSKCLK